MRERIIALVAFALGVAVTLLWQHAAAHLRARSRRARHIASVKRVVAAPDSSGIVLRTYPALPLADGAPPEEPTKVSGRGRA